MPRQRNFPSIYRDVALSSIQVIRGREGGKKKYKVAVKIVGDENDSTLGCREHVQGHIFLETFPSNSPSQVLRIKL